MRQLRYYPPPTWLSLPDKQKAAYLLLLAFVGYTEDKSYAYPLGGWGRYVDAAIGIARGEVPLPNQEQYRELVEKGILSADDGPFVGYVLGMTRRPHCEELVDKFTRITGLFPDQKRKVPDPNAVPLGPEDYELGVIVPPSEPVEEIRDIIAGNYYHLKRDSYVVRWAFANSKSEQMKIREEANSNVTDAIMLAEREIPGTPEYQKAWWRVSMAEECIALITSPVDTEGAIARIGAIRAALQAGDTERATWLRGQYIRASEAFCYLNGVDPLTKEEVQALSRV